MKELQVEGFVVSGPRVRTNNKLESGGSGELPGLWKQFYASHPEVESGVYGVYSNYDSDASGNFDVTAGTKTDAPTSSSIAVESGAYLAFPTKGDVPAAIIEAWKSVWEHFSKKHAYERSYATDFEEYSGPTSATIYVGIKPTS